MAQKKYKIIFGLISIAFLVLFSFCLNIKEIKAIESTGKKPSININLAQKLNQFGQSTIQGFANAGVGALNKLYGQTTKNMPPIVRQLLDSVVSPIFQQLQQSINSGIANMFSPAQTNFLSSTGIEVTKNGLVHPNQLTTLSMNEIAELNKLGDAQIANLAETTKLLDSPSLIENISQSVQQDPPEQWTEFTSTVSGDPELSGAFSNASNQLPPIQQELGQMGPLPNMQKPPPIDNNIISQAAEYAKEKATMGGSVANVGPYAVTGILSVREVGDQLRKIKEMLQETHQIRLSNELIKKYTKNISEIATDEKKNREEKEQEAEKAHNALNQMIKTEQEKAVKSIRPNIITNNLDQFASDQDMYYQYVKKIAREQKDYIAGPFKDEVAKKTVEKNLAEDDQFDMPKKFAVEKCPKAEDVNNASDDKVLEYLKAGSNINCTIMPSIRVYTFLRKLQLSAIETAKLAQQESSSIMPEIEVKDGKPVIQKTKKELGYGVEQTSYQEIQEARGEKATLNPVIAPKNMEKTITQSMAERIQSWLDQVIDQGLSQLADLLSGLMDQNGDNGDNGGNENTNVPPSDQTLVYDLAQADNDLANAKSLLSSQKLLNENLTGQYLKEQQTALNTHIQIQEEHKQILYLLKSLYLGSESTSTLTNLGGLGVSCVLPNWATVSKSGNIIKITTGSAYGDISFYKNGDVIKIDYQNTSQVAEQNTKISATQDRISALGLAISSTENLIALLDKIVNPPINTILPNTAGLPTIEEILSARDTAIKLGARAVNSEAETLIQLDGDTQKFNLDIVDWAIQFAAQRQTIDEILASANYNLTALQTQYQSCPKK